MPTNISYWSLTTIENLQREQNIIFASVLYFHQRYAEDIYTMYSSVITFLRYKSKPTVLLQEVCTYDDRIVCKIFSPSVYMKFESLLFIFNYELLAGIGELDIELLRGAGYERRKNI